MRRRRAGSALMAASICRHRPGFSLPQRFRPWHKGLLYVLSPQCTLIQRAIGQDMHRAGDGIEFHVVGVSVDQHHQVHGFGERREAVQRRLLLLRGDLGAGRCALSINGPLHEPIAQSANRSGIDVHKFWLLTRSVLGTW